MIEVLRSRVTGPLEPYAAAASLWSWPGWVTPPTPLPGR